MHLTGRIFLCCLFFVNFSGLFFERQLSVSGAKPFDKFLGFISPLKSLTGGFDLAKPIKKIIEATKWIKYPKPLTVFTALAETAVANLTKKSLDVVLEAKVTVATITGGAFGSSLFQLHKYQFVWTNCYCNTTYNLKVQVFYFNLKYGSYEKATNYPDGVVVATFPIATNGDYPNPGFTPFGNLLKTKFKAVGNTLKLLSAYTYTWFVKFPLESLYATSKEKIEDVAIGKKYEAITLYFPLDQRKNYISNEQFLSTFVKIGGLDECVDESFSDGLSDPTNIKHHQGIYVCNLPA